MSNSSPQLQRSALDGVCIAILGRLASMSKRDAERTIREHGGRLAERVESADWVVIGDEAPVPQVQRGESERLATSDEATVGRRSPRVVRESEFLSQLGLLDVDVSVARLYTSAMLAGLVRAPVSAIRQWHRIGALQATREVRRLAYFDFSEVQVAQKLAALRQAGCTSLAIQRKLNELSRLLPGLTRPLADPDVLIVGRRICLRRGDGLAEPNGQWLIDFERADESEPSTSRGRDVAVPFIAGKLLLPAAVDSAVGSGGDVSDLRSLASELEESGNVGQAMEAYRAILVSGQADADDHFTLAELLYRTGDLAAARERYYMAIELDEEFVEARANLGCVLAELGEAELAEAAFRGALACHPHYADAHYHLARLLDRTDHAEEAASHWRKFIHLAPASPWADEALERTGGG